MKLRLTVDATFNPVHVFTDSGINTWISGISASNPETCDSLKHKGGRFIFLAHQRASTVSLTSVNASLHVSVNKFQVKLIKDLDNHQKYF